jgi:hypothetical protein
MQEVATALSFFGLCMQIYNCLCWFANKQKTHLRPQMGFLYKF